jgi:hypothetical protein
VDYVKRLDIHIKTWRLQHADKTSNVGSAARTWPHSQALWLLVVGREIVRDQNA